MFVGRWAGTRWGGMARLALGVMVLMLALAGCGTTVTVQAPSATATLAPTFTPTPDVISSYAGTWNAHDDTLKIIPAGTGAENWNAGPCSSTDSNAGMCDGTGSLSFTANSDGSLTGVYQSVSYISSVGQPPAGYQPDASFPKVGDNLTLKHNGPDELTATFNGNTWNYCDSTAMAQGKCGA